ncbi:anks1b, partial [Symbiodinium microadriaticum]
MTGDGNCLFHALANKTQEDGVQLRSLIIQFLQDNAACEDDEEQTDAWLEEAEYLHSNPRHWGGDTAIIAFTLMRQQRVFLHWRTADGEIQTIERTHTDVATAAERRPRERQNFMQAIHLWYNGRDHYDVLEGPNLLEELTSMPVAAEATHPRRKLEDALKHLASTHLRAQPLIPPDARPEEVDSGEAWPQVFCAFDGCTWALPTGTEEELHEHVKNTHKAELGMAAQHLPSPKPADALTSVYNEAVALRCREAAP